MIPAGLSFLAVVLGLTAVGMLGVAEPRRRVRGSGPRGFHAFAALGRVARGVAAPADLDRRIAAAGRPAGMDAQRLMAAKVGAAVAGGLVGASLGPLAPGRLGLVLVAGAPLAGFAWPDVWLIRRARVRAEAARRELPAMLDLLRVAVESGASAPAALAAVGRGAHGIVAREWAAVGGEVELGIPLADALTGLRERVAAPEIAAFCAALERSTRHGVPLGPALAGQAADARSALNRAIREEAAKAGPKIQLVVALLLVPSVLLLVAAALLAAILDGGAVSVY